jgi:dGTPase
VTGFRREEIEKEEDGRLAEWGQKAAESRGRPFDEPEHPYRTAFQRDRDRIIHSTAFRRLQYKTQVFVYHEGDHFRNRLTHTLEVAQIGRTIARALGVNEDLTEAIVLAHDLGHTPFGHSGERALRRLLHDRGGFEHNRQSLRIVDVLEIRSERYGGLNLTHETREGLMKHGGFGPDYRHPVPLPPLGASRSVEAQVANAADEIAYHNHDIDDGLRSGLLTFDDLEGVGLWRESVESVQRDGARGSRVVRARAIVWLINRLVTDLVDATSARLRDGRVSSPESVRALARPVVGFSPEMVDAAGELARFLRERLYHHHRVLRMAVKAERILTDLWTAYTDDERLLPRHVLGRLDDEPRDTVIADYIAGMTDRFAMEEHARMFDPHAHV